MKSLSGVARIGVSYVAALPILSAIWLAAVSGMAGYAYHTLYRFDALDRFAWTELLDRFLDGATIPFAFVAVGCGFALFGLLGWLALIVRLPRIVSSLERRVMAVVAGLPSPPWRRLLRAFRHLPRLPVKAAACGGRKRPFGWRRRLPGGELISPSDGQDSHLDDASPAPPAASVTDISEEAPEPPPIADSTPADARSVALTGVEPALPLVPSDEDMAAFGRALALFEVWADPTPQWMIDSLREELGTLSAGGWTLLSQVGPAGFALLDAAIACNMLPADGPKRAVIDGMQARHQAAEATAKPPDEDAFLSDGAAVEEDAPDQAPAAPSGEMTLCAAWLCELVDNYVMLEDLRQDPAGAEEFNRHWHGIHQETGEHLQAAMRSMSDKDWASLDRFPGRAGRIRVLTDRLREEFRTKVDAKGPPASEEPKPERSDDPPPPAAERLRRALDRLGFDVLLPPAIGAPAPGPAEDVLARRGEVVVFLRVQSLDGAEWDVAEDSLAPWRDGEGRSLLSPTRAVWQRVTLLRSLQRDFRPQAAAVVVADGHFLDESRVAQVAERDGKRTGVVLVRLEGGREGVPDLRSWLEGVLAEADGAGASFETAPAGPPQDEDRFFVADN